MKALLKHQYVCGVCSWDEGVSKVLMCRCYISNQ